MTGLLCLTIRQSLAGGKQRRTVQARSVLCYWGTRELGMSAVGISKKLNIAPSTASESVIPGQQIVENQGLKHLDESLNNPKLQPAAHFLIEYIYGNLCLPSILTPHFGFVMFLTTLSSYIHWSQYIAGLEGFSLHS